MKSQSRSTLLLLHRPRTMSALLLVVILAVSCQQSARTAMAFSVRQQQPMRTLGSVDGTIITSLQLSRDDYLRPHFETSATTSTMERERNYSFDFDRIVECAELGECPIDEMTQMMQELERLDEKEGGSSGVVLEVMVEDQQQDNGAARKNAVLHALNSQVELAKARSELKQAGLERQKNVIETAEMQASPGAPSERDIQDLMRTMRDIADHEEV